MSAPFLVVNELAASLHERAATLEEAIEKAKARRAASPGIPVTVYMATAELFPEITAKPDTERTHEFGII